MANQQNVGDQMRTGLGSEDDVAAYDTEMSTPTGNSDSTISDIKKKLEEVDGEASSLKAIAIALLDIVASQEERIQVLERNQKTMGDLHQEAKMEQVEVAGQLETLEAKQEELEEKQDGLLSRNAENANEVYALKERVLELERYSRKTCLIFNSVDCPNGDPLDNILTLCRNFLGLNLQRSELVACHPLSYGAIAPVIVKFVYHKDRDIVWFRKSRLRDARNSMGYSIFIEECLAPQDNAIIKRAKELKIRTLTKKQRVYAFNPSTNEQFVINHEDQLNEYVRPNYSVKPTEDRNRSSHPHKSSQPSQEPLHIAENHVQPASNPVFYTPVGQVDKTILKERPKRQLSPESPDNVIMQIAKALAPILNPAKIQRASKSPSDPIAFAET